MARIQISTTIDITDTGVRRPDLGSEKEYNQYRNFTTFQQVIGIRSLFSVIEKPSFQDGKWTFVIETDRDGVFSKDNDPLGLLLEDFDQVPILAGLDETKVIKQPVIKTLGKQPNTFVAILQ